MGSSTGRGKEREQFDHYPTPFWCVRRFLEAADLGGEHWFEPCAGEGNIIEVINEFRTGISWTACDIQPGAESILRKLTDDVIIGDFLEQTTRADVIISNPPFNLALPIVQHALTLAEDYVAMLLRLDFLGTQDRCGFLRDNTPDVYVLPNRPSFTPDRQTDSSEYGWFVWNARLYSNYGNVHVLDLTPLDERTRDRDVQHKLPRMEPLFDNATTGSVVDGMEPLFDHEGVDNN